MKKVTPAMYIKVTDHIWSVTELLAARAFDRVRSRPSKQAINEYHFLYLRAGTLSCGHWDDVPKLHLFIINQVLLTLIFSMIIINAVKWYKILCIIVVIYNIYFIYTILLII